MQILGASAMRVAEIFLHPGYISAYPRTFEPDMGYLIWNGDPTLQLNMGEALRLQGDATASAAHVTTPVTTAMAGIPPTTAVILAAVCFFAGLLLVAWMRQRGELRIPPILTLPPLLAVLAWVGTCGPPPLPNEKPWEGVTVRAYADPHQATLALLHGIIADGIINVGQDVSNLANIQNEVGLPTTSPTEGMAYALSTYGLDGWGREFRLDRAGSSYTVRSAGADGSFDTGDDVTMTVSQCNDQSWDNDRHAFFLKRSGTDYLLFVHRWTGDLFRYEAKDEAKSLTGTPLFDVFHASDMNEDFQSRMEATYSEDASGVGDDPLVLQVFGNQY